MIISTRSMVLAGLISLPVLVFTLAGAYAIWQNGSMTWVWWLITGCSLAAWGVSALWKPTSQAGSKRHDLVHAEHWTPRDRDAAAIIRKYQLEIDAHTAEELVDPQFYLQQVQALSMELVKLYHPRAVDPLDRLTVPEVLAAVRLAVDDLERWMLDSVPGSRMLTIRHWRKLPSVPNWLEKASQATWAASILLNPANIVRYFASKWSWDPVAEQLQSEVLAIVYLRFIRQAGFYLIEMNSGRLRGGADAYRAAFDPSSRTGDSLGKQVLDLEELPPVTVALIGQVSSGKSSLVNLLTGGVDAKVDILPQTRQVERFEADLGDPPVRLTLLDTPGYGEHGAGRAQLEQIEQALEQADAALLIMDAHSPAREADRKTLGQLQEYYNTNPQLKPPPVIGVLTHVDLLPPPLQWSPPYDWRTPGDPKAQSLHDAVAYAEELFGRMLCGVVPLCSENGDRQWGVAEELIPALVDVLDDAHSVSLLRAYEAHMDRKRLKTLFQQIRNSGRQILRSWIDERLSGS